MRQSRGKGCVMAVWGIDAHEFELKSSGFISSLNTRKFNKYIYTQCVHYEALYKSTFTFTFTFCA